MKYFVLTLISLLAFVSCEEEPIVEPDGPGSNKYAHIEGYAQKGQLIKGSQVTAFVLDEDLKATGKSYPANISDDLGAFAVDVKVEKPYLELRAEGYFFNEITGEVSESPIYLEAMGNSQSDKLNINLFTTITKPRIKKLLAEDKGWATSTLTAQEELLAALGVKEQTEDFTDIDITGTDRSDAILLAFACIIQQDRSISEIVALIQNAASEFEAEGKLTEKTANAILANRANVDPFEIAHNIADYYSEKSITGKSLPAFYKYLDEKYNKDFVIATGPMMDVSPETSMNYGAIESSCDILADIEFEVECADEDVTIIKKQIIGSLYNVSIAVPENTRFEERTATVVFKDKSGNELARREFKQDANIQIVELQLGSGTKSTVTVQDFLSAMFEDGDKVGVNGNEYPLEVSSPDRAIVKLPRTDSYFFSFPSGSISKADHIARVTVNIPEEVHASTPIPYYAGLESYHGMEIPNPATIRLNPAVAMLGIKPNGFDNISHVVVSGNSTDDVLSGTFTYVPNPEDLMYYPELNPETVKGTGKTITIRHASESGVFYAPLPPIDFSNGFTIKVYDSADQIIGESVISNAFTLKAGQSTTISIEYKYAKPTANCYIVSPGSSISFPAVKGCSNESVGNVASVDVLWETFGSSEIPAVGSVIYNTLYSNNEILVNAGQSQGNAVIAAKDMSGTILWSWHIWVTSEGFNEEVYLNNAGIMMDRNLGALSAEPGKVETLGLLYQWGRKDPFLNGEAIYFDDYSDITHAVSTITWPDYVETSSNTGTIQFSIENPTTAIRCWGGNTDWYYTGDQTSDNSRWASKKTIYDPCPVGWRVPDGGSDGVWATALGSSEERYDDKYGTSDDLNKGIYLNVVDDNTAFYPFSGHMYCGATLMRVGYLGNCWSCTSFYDTGSAYALGYTYSPTFYPTEREHKCEALSVRCIKDN